ncbi:MAG: hypothetical protein Q9201_007762, partial [Fulgogasparrea decipioides]
MEHQLQRSIPFQQLLKHNDLGFVENPLRRIPEDRLHVDIESFHEESDLAKVVDVQTLIRGARLARDEEGFIAEETAQKSLTEVEREALQEGKPTSIWGESREIKIILLTCCVASVAQGWAQGAIVGANREWPREFNFELPNRDVWLFSATNAIAYFAASSVGAFLCDPFTEIFVGRRGAIFAAALFTFTASIGEAFTRSWQALFACRFLLGIGMGAKSSVVPVSFIPALALLLLVFVGSESPRWLIKKQRYREAYSVLLRLHENPLLAARDLVFIWAQLQVETTLFMRTNIDVIDLENRIPYLDPKVYLREIGLSGYARRITQLFTIPRARRATLASFIVMMAQQMTGINVFAFLASTLFEYDQNRLIPNGGSLWLYFGFGIANF